MTDSVCTTNPAVNQEVWKEVPGYSRYQVSNLGNMKSFCYGRETPLTPGVTRKRRHVDIWSDERKNKEMFVYNVVLMTFVGPCPKGMQACHYDGNSMNDRLDNLRWDTPKNNKKDNFRLGIEGFGEKAGRSKLTNSQAKSIQNEYHNGTKVKNLMGKYGLCKTAIWRIIKGVTYKEINHPLYEPQS